MTREAVGEGVRDGKSSQNGEVHGPREGQLGRRKGIEETKTICLSFLKMSCVKGLKICGT